MGLRPAQGDDERSVWQPLSVERLPSPLSSRPWKCFDRVVMGLWPIQGDGKRLGPAAALYGTVTLSFVIPTVEMFRQSCHGPLAHPR
jgi:hypothetical protein